MGELNFGPCGGALGFGDSPSLPGAPSAMQAPGDSGTGLGAPPAADGADIAEAARRTFMKLTGTPPLPAADIPSITEAAAKSLGDAPRMPEFEPSLNAFGGSEFAATSPRWRVDAATPYDALDAQWEAMLSGLAQGYAHSAETAFCRGTGRGSDRLPASAPFGSMQSDLDPSLDADGRSLVQPMHDASRRDAQSFSVPEGTVYTIRNDGAGDGHYGARRQGRRHGGNDLVAAPGEGVFSLIDGTVSHLGWVFRQAPGTGQHPHQGVVRQFETWWG